MGRFTDDKPLPDMPRKNLSAPEGEECCVQSQAWGDRKYDQVPYENEDS